MTTFILQDKTERELIEEHLGVKVKNVVKSKGKTYIMLDDAAPVSGNLETQIQDLFKNKKVKEDKKWKPERVIHDPKDMVIQEKHKYKNLPAKEKLQQLKVELRHYLTVEDEIKRRSLKARRGVAGRKKLDVGQVTPLITQTRTRIEELLDESPGLRLKYREPLPLRGKKART